MNCRHHLPLRHRLDPLGGSSFALRDLAG